MTREGVGQLVVCKKKLMKLVRPQNSQTIVCSTHLIRLAQSVHLTHFGIQMWIVKQGIRTTDQIGLVTVLDHTRITALTEGRITAETTAIMMRGVLTPTVVAQHRTLIVVATLILEAVVAVEVIVAAGK